jgi:hypothetical protein
MATKRAMKPAAQVTLVEGLTYRLGKHYFRKGVPRTITGEALIARLETNSRFHVKRLSDLKKETIERRKKIKPIKKKKSASKKSAATPAKGKKAKSDD